jgi:membrane protease YdiL (CAAX protease family)
VPVAGWPGIRVGRPGEPSGTSMVRFPEVAMSPTVSLVRRHRLAAFFVLALALGWLPWPFAAAGLIPAGFAFFAGSPLVAALVVIGVAEGRAGYRDLLARCLRWRVGWVWYVVAVGLPAALVLLTGLVNSWFGAPAPALAAIAWTDVALLFALRMVDPTDGALGEEPGWRGYALPHLQSRWGPLSSAAVLGVVVSLWHVPLVALHNLTWIGLPTTFAITFLYVWLFNRTGGSVLLTMVFHASQGALTYGRLGYEGADLQRAELIYLGVVVLAVAATVVFDRGAWRAAPPSAVAVPREPAVARTAA